MLNTPTLGSLLKTHLFVRIIIKCVFEKLIQIAKCDQTLASRGSSVVEHLAHIPKDQGFNLTIGREGERGYKCDQIHFNNPYK
jgi:hypothetical protein